MKTYAILAPDRMDDAWDGVGDKATACIVLWRCYVRSLKTSDPASLGGRDILHNANLGSAQRMDGMKGEDNDRGSAVESLPQTQAVAVHDLLTFSMFTRTGV